MGSNNSKADTLHYEAKDWNQIQKSALYEVMRNSKGEQGHLYHFNIKEDRKLDDEVDIYAKRRSTGSNWVQVLGANLSSSGFGFCGAKENANVLTEAIPFLLGSLPRFNRQDSAVVLYNALRGYSDISKFVVPGAITSNMIGFNRNGQTKVWVNENFGMNHPNNQSVEAHFDEAQFLDSFVTAVSPKLDLNPDFLNSVRNSRTLENALNFTRANGGVAKNVLEANRVNVSSFGQQTSTVLNSKVAISLPAVQTTSSFSELRTYQPAPRKWVTPNVYFVYNYESGEVRRVECKPGSNTNIPASNQYQPVQNKFSFTTPQ